MIVCLCAGVNETTIKKCIEDGCTLEELKINLGVCQTCFSCEQELNTLYNNKEIYDLKEIL